MAQALWKATEHKMLASAPQPQSNAAEEGPECKSRGLAAPSSPKASQGGHPFFIVVGVAVFLCSTGRSALFWGFAAEGPPADELECANVHLASQERSILPERNCAVCICIRAKHLNALTVEGRRICNAGSLRPTHGA